MMLGGTAKTYENMTKIGEPYRKDNGNFYIKVKDGEKEREVRWYTPAQLHKMYPDYVAVSDDKFYKTQKEVLGFDKGYITIFKGDTYAHLDYFNASPCRFNKWFKWFLPSTCEDLTDLPSDLVALKVTWEEVGKPDGKLKNDDEVNAVMDTYFFDPSDSEWVGAAGERLALVLTYKGATPLEGIYGAGNIYSFEDEKGNVFNWGTSVKKALEEGMTYNIKGTVKDHKVYKNVKQTWLTRCTVEGKA